MTQQSAIDPAVFSEVQMVLAEKRTSLATLRTGIAVFALPLSVLGFLVITSKYYEPTRVLHFLIPLLALSGALAVFGVYLVVQSMLRLRRYEQLIQKLKHQYGALAQWI